MIVAARLISESSRSLFFAFTNSRGSGLIVQDLSGRR
jgi:hypothetical protein